MVNLRSIHTPSYNLCLSCLGRRSNSIRHLGLHIRNHAQQILNDLVPSLVPRLLDPLQLLVRIFAGIFFRFLVAACVLLLEFLELVIFFLPVVFNLFLCFVLGVFDTLRSVFSSFLDYPLGLSLGLY